MSMSIAETRGMQPKLAATIEETSFKPLADWVHAQGLLFGIHIVRGIPRASVERNLPIADSSFHASGRRRHQRRLPVGSDQLGREGQRSGAGLV